MRFKVNYSSFILLKFHPLPGPVKTSVILLFLCFEHVLLGCLENITSTLTMLSSRSGAEDVFDNEASPAAEFEFVCFIASFVCNRIQKVRPGGLISLHISC